MSGTSGLTDTFCTEHYHYESTGFSAVEEAFSNWKGIYNISVSDISEEILTSGSYLLFSYASYTVRMIV